MGGLLGLPGAWGRYVSAMGCTRPLTNCALSHVAINSNERSVEKISPNKWCIPVVFLVRIFLNVLNSSVGSKFRGIQIRSRLLSGSLPFSGTVNWNNPSRWWTRWRFGVLVETTRLGQNSIFNLTIGKAEGVLFISSPLFRLTSSIIFPQTMGYSFWLLASHENGLRLHQCYSTGWPWVTPA